MANRFSQVFTLTDIFNDQKLKNKLPLINYKEIEKENGKISKRTNVKTVNRQIFDTSISAARPFYKPIVTSRGGNKLIISGNLVGDHDGAVDAVYNALMAKKEILVWTANNTEMIRSALKEAENNKRKYGINTKLYLRVQSIEEIRGMTKKEIQSFMDNVMENIFYSDNFPQTQKKFGVESLPARSPYSYKERKLRWKFKVGDV